MDRDLMEGPASPDPASDRLTNSSDEHRVLTSVTKSRDTDLPRAKASWLERGEKLAVIISTLVAIGSLLYSASRDRRAVQIEQRAWVGVSQWELDREPEDGLPITVRTTLVNKGQSPALNVVSKARLSILAAPISDDWEGVPGRNAAPMFPEATGHGFNTTITITPGTAAAYRAGKLTV